MTDINQMTDSDRKLLTLAIGECWQDEWPLSDFENRTFLTADDWETVLEKVVRPNFEAFKNYLYDLLSHDIIFYRSRATVIEYWHHPLHRGKDDAGAEFWKGGLGMERMNAEELIKYPSWRGAVRRRFRWSCFRFEWGRMCYITDCTGATLDSWWEWEGKDGH